MKIKKVSLTKENLTKIEKLDASFYKDSTTGINWYLERFNEKHNAYFLIDKDLDVAGYILSVPIKKELYDAIESGVLLNDIHINPKMFIEKSNYHYIYSCIIKKEHRNKNYGQKLIEALLNDIKGNICCITVSKGGYNLVNKYMNLKENLNETISVFTKNNN